MILSMSQNQTFKNNIADNGVNYDGTNYLIR